MQLLLISMWRVKVFAYLIGIHFLVLVVLGIIFDLLLFGLTLALSRLVGTFNPAYQLVGRVLGIQGLPAHLAKPPTWYRVYSAALLVVPLAIIAAGLWVLVHVGFVGRTSYVS